MEPTEPVQEVQTTPNSHHNINKWAVVSIFLVILSFLSSGYLAYQNMQLRKQLIRPATYEECIQASGSLVQESYPAVCTTLSGDSFVQPLTEEEQRSLLTADWETYTDTNIGFSLKYPSDWSYKVSETNTTTGGVTFDTGIRSQTEKVETTGYWNYSLDIFLETSENYLQWSQSLEQTQSLGTEDIHGKKFEKYVVGDLGYSLNYIYKADDGRIFRFLLYPYEKDKNPSIPADLEETTTQILSTFKFLDSTGYTCPTGEDPNCESGPMNPELRLECTPEYQAWAIENCLIYRTGAGSSSPTR